MATRTVRVEITATPGDAVEWADLKLQVAEALAHLERYPGQVITVNTARRQAVVVQTDESVIIEPPETAV